MSRREVDTILRETTLALSAPGLTLQRLKQRQVVVLSLRAGGIACNVFLIIYFFLGLEVEPRAPGKADAGHVLLLRYSLCLLFLATLRQDLPSCPGW